MKTSAARKLVDRLLDEDTATYKEFFSYLTEVKKATVGRYTAYGHQTHFVGGEYHGHCDVGGGKQISFTITGKALHPNKFPAHVPKDAMAAIAKLLGKPVERFGESYWIEADGQKLLLLETKT